MEEWAHTIRESRHTRYPVCGESADDVVGILNTQDYFRLTDQSRETVLERAVEPAYFVPERVKADVLFRNMREEGRAMAVVLDEYGGMTGILTLSDLVEQLVGELGQEETEEPLIQPWSRAPGRSGERPLWKRWPRPWGSPCCREYDTFNGLVFGAWPSSPQDGDTVEVETQGLCIQVTHIRNHQVESALVTLAREDTKETELAGK